MMTVLVIAAAVMSALSLVLHAVAPHTDSTFDDRAAEAIDKIKALVEAAEGAATPSTIAKA